MSITRLQQEARAFRRSERFSQDAVCSQCGERSLIVLIPGSQPTMCYRCRTVQEGNSGLEAHHIDGQHNNEDTVLLPANEHRLLSELQRDWPVETLLNSDSSPLLKMAAGMRGFLDMLKLLIDRVLGWIPTTLEALDAALRRMHGNYWIDGPLAACFAGAV